MLTPEDLNALIMIVSDAQIKGRDAQFIAGLLSKLQRILQDAQAPKAELEPPQ